MWITCSVCRRRASVPSRFDGVLLGVEGVRQRFPERPRCCSSSFRRLGLCGRIPQPSPGPPDCVVQATSNRSLASSESHPPPHGRSPSAPSGGVASPKPASGTHCSLHAGALNGASRWRTSPGSSEGESAPGGCVACPSPVHGDRHWGALPLRPVDHLAWERFPGADVTLGGVRPVAELARSARRAVDDDLGRVVVVRVSATNAAQPCRAATQRACQLAREKGARGDSAANPPGRGWRQAAGERSLAVRLWP